VTFIKACGHITNYTASHESRTSVMGEEQCSFPLNHIEADCGLSWVLGKLDRRYGDNALYVHLKRDVHETAASFVRQWGGRGIIKGYLQGIKGFRRGTPILDICVDYCHTVNANIEHFLKDKSRVMVLNLESAKQDFTKFWSFAQAQGDLVAALAEYDIHYNSSIQR
jgi:hypothetical protein